MMKPHPGSLGLSGGVGRNVGNNGGRGSGGDVERKWRYRRKEGTPVESENLLEVQTVTQPSSSEEEHECDQWQ